MIPDFIVRNRKALLLPTGLLALFLLAVMKYADSQFSNKEAPMGQGSMQFAFTHTKMFHIVHSFDAHQMKWARYSALIDYPFMAAYTLAFSVLALYRGDANDVSKLIVYCLIVGMIADGFESVGLLEVLDNPVDFNPLLPPIISILAIIKFVLLAVGIVYIIRPFGQGSSTVKSD